MTTTAPPRPHTDDPAGLEPGPLHRSGRIARWRSSWAVALRMARRDVRRHRGRSALVVVMVLLPTMLLSVLATVAASAEVSGTEQVAPYMGSGQAFVRVPQPTAIGQAPGRYWSTTQYDDPALTVPGYDPEAGPFANADAMSRFLGGTAVPTDSVGARSTVDDRRVTYSALVLDASSGLGERVTLTAGRWPTGTGEALVTSYGVRLGLSPTGMLTTTVDGRDLVVRVVGTAELPAGREPAGLVLPEPVEDVDHGDAGWIVTGRGPVGWQEVRDLNAHGMAALSAAVLADPPPADALPDEVRWEVEADGAQHRFLVTIGGSMLLIVTTLLVGPAFAVSAARQRRTLALTASNGATTAVLRRTVLAQALILGTLTGAAGAVLGVPVAAGVLALSRDGAGLGISGPLDVRPGLLAGIAVCATLSTLVAALAPARRLGRLDIVGVMRGQSVSPRPSPAVLALGLVLLAAGAFVLLSGTGVVGVGVPGLEVLFGSMNAGAETVVALGGVAVILGSLFCVPVLLAGVGRLGRHLPTPLRMAARDLARHRSRSAPAVAAVLAAVAGLTFGLVGLASDTEQARREYLPQALPGEALVQVPPTRTDAADVVARTAPELLVTPVSGFDTGDPWRSGLDEAPTEPYRSELLAAVPEGCTPDRLYQDPTWRPTSQADELLGPECMRHGTQANGTGLVLVLPAEELQRRLGLDARDAAVVRSGGAVLLGGDPVDTVRVVRGRYEVDPLDENPGPADVTVLQDVEVPAVVLPNAPDASARMLGATLAVAAGTATSRDWPLADWNISLRNPSGAPVDAATAERLQQALGDDAWIQVERGFERDDAVAVAILLGVMALVILVVVLTSTALTLAEQQTDQATLAALGATRGTRRAMAAAQAFALSVVGCLLGVAVGVVPGLAVAVVLTREGFDPATGGWVTGGDPVLVVPWLQLAAAGVLVPVLAAAMAAAGIRRAPTVTRRAT